MVLQFYILLPDYNSMKSFLLVIHSDENGDYFLMFIYF